MNNENIENTIRRTRSYWYVDGLWEIGYGCLFTTMGFLFYLQAIIPDESLSANLLQYGFLVLIIALIVLINWSVRKIKEHLTYTRTGMVTYRREKMSAGKWLVAAITTAGSILAGSVLYALFQVWETALEFIPLLLGLLGAAMMVFIAYSNNLRRFYLLAFISLLSGLVLSWAGITGMTLLGVYFILLGLGLVISGGVTLWNYLNQTSIPREMPNEC
jgi:hypothetical protein